MRGRKRKADETAPPLVTTSPYNPLRDRQLLEQASRAVASTIIKQNVEMTAMTFCVAVLKSLGLAQIAIGQAERITISGFRKAALKDKDSELIVKPSAPAPVIVPNLSVIMGNSGDGPPVHKEAVRMPRAFRERLDECLDCAALRTRSLVCTRAFFSPGDVKQIVRDLYIGGAASSDRATALRESSGTGRNAAYCDVNLGKSPHLKALLDALTATLKEKLGCEALGSKVVCTRYGPCGVNYAHQDQSIGGYQAYLLLSKPKVDFGGGDLYIVDPASVLAGAKQPIQSEPWQEVGDLVVFAANGKANCGTPRAWLHGFREVVAGTSGEDNCHLCVVGLME